MRSRLRWGFPSPTSEIALVTTNAMNDPRTPPSVGGTDRTLVEDVRQLRENVRYAPAKGRFKIYLIDEVHMLSSAAFNALLKTLEEPPDHVKFIFATTEPQVAT